LTVLTNHVVPAPARAPTPRFRLTESLLPGGAWSRFSPDLP
jgi:hypothetical protein